MKLPTFTPHKVTPEEIEICKQLEQQQYLYCREHECCECPFLDEDCVTANLSCKILYAYQFCKEQRQ